MNSNQNWNTPVRYLIFSLLFLLFLIGLWYIRTIIEPVIIAAFIAYLLTPAVNYFSKRTRLSRNGAVTLVYLIMIILVIGTPASLTSFFFDELKQVVADVLDLFNQMIVWLDKPRAFPGIPFDFGQLADQLIQFRSTFLSSLPDQTFQILGKTSMGAVWVIVILATVYYFLSKWPSLRDGFIGSFPEKYVPEIRELYQRVSRIWINYLRGQLLLMLVVGVAFTISWTIIGIPGAVVLGVIAGFLTLIPDLGPAIGVALAVGVALLEGSNWSWMPASHLAIALIALAAYFVLISIKNFWVRPVIMGRSVQMNEALVLITILLATVLWGILGALIIVPVLASLFVIFDYLRRRVLGLPPFPEMESFVSHEIPPSGSEKIAAIKSKISRKKKT